MSHSDYSKQASHDKRRYRWFVAQGMTILRFTGSEIFNDVGACGEEITNVLSDLVYEYMVKTQIAKTHG